MSKYIAVLTNAFPWGSWEPYLEDEIKHYPTDNSVHIFALSVRQDQQATKREVPKGIKIHKIDFCSAIFYMMYALKGLSIDGLKDLFLAFKEKRLSLRYIIRWGEFIARSRYEADVVIKVLSSLLNHDDELVIYSYRMEYQAYIAKLVKDAFPNSKIIIRGHRFDLYEQENRPIPLRKLAFNSADWLLPVSRDGQLYLEKEFPEFKNKIIVSYLGSSTIKKPIWEYSDTLRLLTCSTLTPQKNIKLLIDALIRVEYKVEWTHYGDGPLREEFDRQVQDLPNNVRFNMMGHVAHDVFLDALEKQVFDIFINTSKSEGVPVSIMEALSAGIPVIATDVGGNREIVKDNVTGWLISSDSSPSDLNDVLQVVYEKKQAGYNALSNSVYNFWCSNFSSDSNYNLFVDWIYSNLQVGPTQKLIGD